MAAETDAPSSVLAEVMRVAKLDATGATPAGASSLYVTDALVMFSWSQEVEAGIDLTQRKANGDLCVMTKTPDVVKRYNCSLAVCAPDPELTQLLAGGLLLAAAGATVGYGAPKLGSDPVPDGVSLELWSLAYNGDVPAATNPYFWWAMPKIKFEKQGERRLESGIMAVTFDGYMYENPGWANGPNNDWLLNSDRAWQQQRTDTLPTSAIGLQATPTQA